MIQLLCYFSTSKFTSLQQTLQSGILVIRSLGRMAELKDDIALRQQGCCSILVLLLFIMAHQVHQVNWDFPQNMIRPENNKKNLVYESVVWLMAKVGSIKVQV